MVVILALLLVDVLRRPFDFASLAIVTAEDKNIHDTSMGACYIDLADYPNIIVACMLGYFVMVWTPHVFLQSPPSSLPEGWVIGHRRRKSI